MTVLFSTELSPGLLSSASPGWKPAGALDTAFQESSHLTDSRTASSTLEVFSMARSMNPNSAGSQFFIMVEDCIWTDSMPHLEKVEGMDEADHRFVPRNMMDVPTEDQVIKTITIK